MSKGRISSHERASRGPALGSKGLSAAPKGDLVRFIGLSLGGGKADKACIAIIDAYPKHHKVFLTKVFEKIKNDENLSADQKILDLIQQHSIGVESIAFDVPWEMPLCFVECRKECAGYDTCTEPHIQWMRSYFQRINKKKKPKRMFTPYTQRCAELYLSTELEEPFQVNAVLGANSAPLAARAAFLRRRLNFPAIEINTRVSMWRMGRSLDVMKSHLRAHRHSVAGEDSRRAFLHTLVAQNLIFFYDQDLRSLAENGHAFEAFLSALTGFLKYRKQTEPRPEGFPKQESWIEIPVKDIKWKGF